jgi:hypothetical protein
MLHEHFLTQNIIPGKILRRDYELNIEKTLEKKLLAAKRVTNIKYNNTACRVVGRADAECLFLLTGKLIAILSV